MVAASAGDGSAGKGSEQLRLPPLRLTPSEVHRDVYILAAQLRRPKNQHGRPRPPPVRPQWSDGSGGYTTSRLVDHTSKRRQKHQKSHATSKGVTGLEQLAPQGQQRQRGIEAAYCAEAGAPAAALLRPVQSPPLCLLQRSAEFAPPPVKPRSFQPRRRIVAAEPPSPPMCARAGDGLLRTSSSLKEDEERTEERTESSLGYGVSPYTDEERAAIAAVVRELVQDNDTKVATAGQHESARSRDQPHNTTTAERTQVVERTMPDLEESECHQSSGRRRLQLGSSSGGGSSGCGGDGGTAVRHCLP